MDVKRRKIISENEFSEIPYNVYLYNGELKIIIENKEYDLYEAIQSNKITIQDIIDKAKNDAKSIDGWDDGGSIIYVLKNFKIIKYNSMNGNKDLYIGSKDLDYSVGDIER